MEPQYANSCVKGINEAEGAPLWQTIPEALLLDICFGDFGISMCVFIFVLIFSMFLWHFEYIWKINSIVIFQRKLAPKKGCKSKKFSRFEFTPY